MTKRIVFEDVKRRIEFSEKYILLSKEYHNNHSKLEICDSEGYKYYYSLSHILHHVEKNGTGLDKFNVSNKHVIYNISLWLSKNKSDIIFVRGEYLGAYEKNLVFICNKCSQEFVSCWNYISDTRRHGCNICASKIPSKKNTLLNYPDIIYEWNYLRNKDNPDNFSFGSHTKVWWKCKNCLHEWMAEIKSRVSGNGCPNCYESKGEHKIYIFLIAKKIIFVREHIFDACKNKRGLPFDFYLPEYNACIEYDGILHYENKFNSDNFEEIKVRDNIKTKYCSDNNIPLLRIPYWEYENIEKILGDFLSNI